MKKLILVEGKKFRNKANHVITIDRVMGAGEAGYDKGFRFVDTAGTPYTETGSFMGCTTPHDFDIVEALPDDYVETVDTTVIVVKMPGLFGRLAEIAREHPVKTTVVVAGGVGAGVYGVHNYRTYGNVLPPRVLGWLRRKAEA